MKTRDIAEIFRDAFFEWFKDRGPMLAAATSYYILLSLTPTMILLIVVMGRFLGRLAAQSNLLEQIGVLAGPAVGEAIESVILSASDPAASYTATLLGVLFLFIWSGGTFVQIKGALGIMWGGRGSQDRVLERTLASYLLSFLLVMGLGILLLLSTAFSALAIPLLNSLNVSLPLNFTWLYLVSFVSSLTVVTLLLAAVYKLLIDVKITWTSAFLGSAVTALFFVIGNRVMDLVLSLRSTFSIFGTISSLLVFLIWLYYSIQIFYYGAELIKVYTRRVGPE